MLYIEAEDKFKNFKCDKEIIDYIYELTNKIGNLETELEKAQDDIRTFECTVDNLNDTISELEDEISDLESDMEIQQCTISVLNNKAIKLQNKLLNRDE